MTQNLVRMHRIRRSGFTLIEILVVVAIVAILAAIALPSYTAYIASARRADARTQLLQAAQFMQRFYAANDRYDQDRANPPNSVFNRIPDNLKRSPADGTMIYQLPDPSVSGSGTVTQAAYTLHMVPTGGMASDKCGTYTITSTGVRGVIVGGTAYPTGSLRDSCWK